MAGLTRRSVVRGSLGLAAAGAIGRPFVANAAAKTAEVWFAQGFVKEEDTAFIAMIGEYEKATGNKIEHSEIPYAALRQKAVSAITSGAVPDMIEVADFALAPLQAWDDKLVDISDIVEPVKSQYISTALPCTHFYNNVTKKRAYYVLPMKIAAVPFHIWKSLVEKGGAKIEDLPKTWDAFLDFFPPVQDGLRKADHDIQEGLCPARRRQLERCRRQQRVPFEIDGDGFRWDDLDRGGVVVDREEGRIR
jgi:multiple sugar transport system substrate-binding protein